MKNSHEFVTRINMSLYGTSLLFFFLYAVATVLFSEVDYSLIPEDAQNLTATVVRRVAIATPIIVLVYPLNNTYANQTRVPGAPPVIFEGEPLHLSEETLIPPDDPERPTVAKS